MMSKSVMMESIVWWVGWGMSVVSEIEVMTWTTMTRRQSRKRRHPSRLPHDDRVSFSANAKRELEIRRALLFREDRQVQAVVR